MIVGIHQPNYMPWLGYFYKIVTVDTFVVLDDVPFSKGSYTNRCQIKGPNGPQWMTIPVVTKGKLGQPINEVAINTNLTWRDKHIKTLQQAYAKAPHLKQYLEPVAEVMSEPAELLVDLNCSLLRFFCCELGIETPMVFSSQMKAEGTSSDRLASICSQLGATTYLSGAGGVKYQDEKTFLQAGIELRTTDFIHPEYPQLLGDFVKGLSIVDLLFNCGPDSADILRQAGGGDR